MLFFKSARTGGARGERGQSLVYHLSLSYHQTLISITGGIYIYHVYYGIMYNNTVVKKYYVSCFIYIIEKHSILAEK